MAPNLVMLFFCKFSFGYEESMLAPAPVQIENCGYLCDYDSGFLLRNYRRTFSDKVQISSVNGSMEC